MLPMGILLWLISEIACSVRSSPAATVTFAADVRPILERRCTPCHFAGGVMHAKLPFDQPATIEKLGTRLFTRIKRDDEQQVLRAFLVASARRGASGVSAAGSVKTSSAIGWPKG